MKSGLFARPNLKLFLAGGVLLLWVVELVSNDRAHSRPAPAPIPVEAQGHARAELRFLLQQAIWHPSSGIYAELCSYHERRGDFRKALFYLRKADALAQREELDP